MVIRTLDDYKLISDAYESGKVVEMHKDNQWLKIMHRNLIKYGNSYRVIKIEIA